MVEIKELDGSQTDSDYVTDSEVSDFEELSDIEEEDSDETFLQRIVALKDAVPLTTRNTIYSSVTGLFGLTKTGYSLFRTILWFSSTTALLLVFPLALEADKEQVMIQYEKEQQMLQQSVTPAVQPPTTS
ncbi:hypothetical protein BB561_002948 [Smittium simulii]|uniref:Mitochondrial import receptor subunit Tom22 n=1 Tax=Smittium simulii TaxID=133385 RepID=A0A2T9YNP4_9FUNG|nr:hypothetical protein BB561_002948 [Smittium simulii]